MLTDMMEGRILLAPDDGADLAASPVDYGTGNVTSAPDSGNAVEKADNASVGSEGTSATNSENTGAEEQKSPAWMAQLPKDLRDDPELARHRTMGEAIKYLKEQASSGKEAQGNEEKAPSSESQEKVPVKYENFAKKFSDSTDPFGNVSDEVVKTLQESGVDQALAESLVEKIDKAFSEGTSKLVQEGSKHTEAVMKKQWGKDYESNRRSMAKGYQALGDTDGSLQKRMDEEGASLSPAVWELLSRVGRLVSEDDASSSRSGQTQPRNPEVPVTYKY